MVHKGQLQSMKSVKHDLRNEGLPAVMMFALHSTACIIAAMMQQTIKLIMQMPVLILHTV